MVALIMLENKGATDDANNAPAYVFANATPLPRRLHDCAPQCNSLATVSRYNVMNLQSSTPRLRITFDLDRRCPDRRALPTHGSGTPGVRQVVGKASAPPPLPRSNAEQRGEHKHAW